MNTSSLILYHTLKIRAIDAYGTRGGTVVVSAILDIVQKTISPFKFTKNLQYNKYSQIYNWFGILIE